MHDAGWSTEALSVLSSTVRLATPLCLAASGGLVSERAGIVALGLEGMMLAGAFAAGAVAAVTGSPWPALGAGIGAGMSVALLLATIALTQRSDQVVAGIALNLLIAGLCPALGLGWFDEGGGTPSLAPEARFMPIAGGLNLLALATFGLPLAIWCLLYRSRFGLHLRAAGENPATLAAAGIGVAGTRYRALALCGALAGTAGAYLAVGDGAGFTRGMTAGRGYVALAALIFGGWRPIPTTGACLLFAAADAVQLRVQGAAHEGAWTIPAQLVEALPYLVTIVALAGYPGRSRAPSALGQAMGGSD